MRKFSRIIAVTGILGMTCALTGCAELFLIFSEEDTWRTNGGTPAPDGTGITGDYTRELIRVIVRDANPTAPGTGQIITTLDTESVDPNTYTGDRPNPSITSNDTLINLTNLSVNTRTRRFNATRNVEFTIQIFNIDNGLPQPGDPPAATIASNVPHTLRLNEQTFIVVRHTDGGPQLVGIFDQDDVGTVIPSP